MMLSLEILPRSVASYQSFSPSRLFSPALLSIYLLHHHRYPQCTCIPAQAASCRIKMLICPSLHRPVFEPNMISIPALCSPKTQERAGYMCHELSAQPNSPRRTSPQAWGHPVHMRQSALSCTCRASTQHQLTLYLGPKPPKPSVKTSTCWPP